MHNNQYQYPTASATMPPPATVPIFKPASFPLSPSLPIIPTLPPAPKRDPGERAAKASAVHPRKSCPTPPPVLVDKKAHNEYTRGSLLGEGGFARCYRAQDASGVPLAAKVVSKASLRTVKEKHKLLAEIKIHQSLAHKYIVQFHHVFEDDEFVYMILEVCENRTFVEMLRKRKRLTEPEVAYYMWQLLEAVEYMHKNNVIHRDLKLGNLFLTRDMLLKIGDFGLAANIKNEGERKRTICGTPNYIAPEVLFDTQNGHSFEVDLWSVGVIMYTMIVGRPPFQTKDIKAIYKKIRDNSYSFPEDVVVSADARDIIGSLLSTKPENRPSIEAIMRHSFFNPSRIPLSVPSSAVTEIPLLQYPTPPTPPSKLPQPVHKFAHVNNQNYQHSQIQSLIAGKTDHVLPQSRPVSAVGSQRPMSVLSSISSTTRHSSKSNIFSKSIGVTRHPAHDPNLNASRPKSAEPPENQENVDHLKTKPTTKQTNWGGVWANVAEKRLNSPMSKPKYATAIPVSPPIRSSESSTTASHSPVSKSRQRIGHCALKSAESSISNSSNPPQAERQPGNNMSWASSSKSHSTAYSPQIAHKKPLSTLEKIWMNIDGALNQNQAVQLSSLSLSDEIDSLPKVFISKWIDYSNKYGLGYQLRDGAVGVYFNDSTSIILSADNVHFEYLYYEFKKDNSSSSASISSAPTIHRDAYVMHDFPESLTKKVTLLKHFRGYMSDNLTKAFSLPEDDVPRTHNLHFLTKYLRTKHGVVFRLSNGVLQLNLFDHTKLILTQNGLVVTYMNKRREITTAPIVRLLQNHHDTTSGPSREIMDRLKYFQDVIHQMIVKKQSKAPS